MSDLIPPEQPDPADSWCRFAIDLHGLLNSLMPTTSEHMRGALNKRRDALLAAEDEHPPTKAKEATK